MSWSDKTQARFDELRRRELARSLTAVEQTELAELMGWLTKTADTALETAVARLEQEQSILQEQLQRRQDENEALARLLHQQEQLVVESRRWLADFDKRHKQISQAYTRLTGDALTPA